MILEDEANLGFKRVTALALRVGQGFGGEADFSGFIFLSPGIFPTESCIAASFRGGAGKSRHDGVPARRGKGEAIWLFIPVRSKRRCSVFWEGGKEKKKSPPHPGKGEARPRAGVGLARWLGAGCADAPALGGRERPRLALAQPPDREEDAR